jgi:hypothetical protein
MRGRVRKRDQALILVRRIEFLGDNVEGRRCLSHRREDAMDKCRAYGRRPLPLDNQQPGADVRSLATYGCAQQTSGEPKPAHCHHRRWLLAGERACAGTGFTGAVAFEACCDRQAKDRALAPGTGLRGMTGACSCSNSRFYAAQRHEMRAGGPTWSGDVEDGPMRTRPAAQQVSRRRTINPELPRFVYPNGSGYRALIRSGDKILYLGTFDTPEKASEAAERMARELRRKANARSKRPNAGGGAKGKATPERTAVKRRRRRSA